MVKIAEPPDFPELLPATSKENKDKNWEQVEEYINHITDGLGMPVDEGIKKPVIALNLLGFRTEQSCEGHLDRSLAPWIRLEFIDSPEINDLGEKAHALYDRLEKVLKTHDRQSPEVNAISREYHEINRKRREPSLRATQKAFELLIDFYADRQVRADIHLDVSRTGKIHSLGSEFLEVQTEELKASTLKEYQHEMSAFGDFLVNKYFEN